ncbi:MAG: YeeE/YedE family protein [Kiloniellaceae bacterium]
MAIAAESLRGTGTGHARAAVGEPPGLPRPDWRVVALAGVLLLGGAAYLSEAVAWRQAALYVLGGALGLVLYHAAFGFSSSWRVFVSDGRGAGLRAQMLMLAVASAIFLPALADGSLFGRPVGGAVAPFGTSVLVGAFLFGVGMQLGGGCASGTLYTVGGGSSHMVVTLVFFMAGSLLGSAHLPWWLGTPSLGSISLLRELGLTGALAAQLGAFAALALASALIERRRHGTVSLGFALRAGPAAPRPRLTRRLLQGPWPLLWGAVLLALLNAATLVLAGHPWTVSFGYTLWGAKAAAALGVDVASWEFWTWRYPRQALEGGVLAEATSVMNLGILVGAFLAAGLAGRFAPRRRIAWGVALAAALGGLLMGYGARLAFGCNIGAYFSGIASGSLHGWLWLVAALAGTYVGTALRPAFGLAVERRRRGGC